MDLSLAEAHTSLAWATLHYDYDFSTAEREFERSIELNPRSATAHHWFGMSLGLMGRYEEGYAELKRALRWLETAYRERGEWLVLLKVDPRFDSLRSDPRFEDLLRRMNFPA
jgi:Tfp pilus assembly protein PilF